jgi:hypothetical protein
MIEFIGGFWLGLIVGCVAGIVLMLKLTSKEALDISKVEGSIIEQKEKDSESGSLKK